MLYNDDYIIIFYVLDPITKIHKKKVIDVIKMHENEILIWIREKVGHSCINVCYWCNLNLGKYVQVIFCTIVWYNFKKTVCHLLID